MNNYRIQPSCDNCKHAVIFHNPESTEHHCGKVAGKPPKHPGALRMLSPEYEEWLDKQLDWEQLAPVEANGICDDYKELI